MEKLGNINNLNDEKIDSFYTIVCSVAIDLTVEDGVIREVCFEGGCSGNLQGISMLVRGMKVEEVIERLEGIQCGSKRTSCPDQLVKALKEIERC